jgi:hypothetical protein
LSLFPAVEKAVKIAAALANPGDFSSAGTLPRSQPTSMVPLPPHPDGRPSARLDTVYNVDKMTTLIELNVEDLQFTLALPGPLRQPLRQLVD